MMENVRAQPGILPLNDESQHIKTKCQIHQPTYLAERGQHVMQVLVVDEAVPVVVDHVEGFLELLYREGCQC